MPICIECRHPVETLWSWSSGRNIRLTVCKNCGRFCDKYVEHDYIVLFIDLVLIKPQVCVCVCWARAQAQRTIGKGNGRLTAVCLSRCTGTYCTIR